MIDPSRGASPLAVIGFLGFCRGVKTCPGRSYSEVLSSAVLIKMLQTFEDIELAPGHSPVKLVEDTVLAPDKDIQLKLTPRARK
jgi:cytochrome P450